MNVMKMLRIENFPWIKVFNELQISSSLESCNYFIIIHEFPGSCRYLSYNIYFNLCCKFVSYARKFCLSNRCSIKISLI